MNALERALIAKAGYANGFENVSTDTPEGVLLYSARHKAMGRIEPDGETPEQWRVTFPKGPSFPELSRSFPNDLAGCDAFRVAGEVSLGRLLRRAAELAMSLPNQAAEFYASEIAKLEANPPSSTEALALVKQRRGQDLFRAAQMDYWGGACAVTGIAVPELLRASHAKPWAKCATDEERLNVYNGFLLCAHLDALFDRGLMTFDREGDSVLSDLIDETTRKVLNLSGGAKLRWLADKHGPFLDWHREHVFRSGGQGFVLSWPQLQNDRPNIGID